jgi:hypothetical protein
MEKTMSDEINACSYTFTDRKKREWDVTVTLAGIRRMEKGDYSLMYPKPVVLMPPTKEFFPDLLGNPALLWGMIWVLCKPQADAKQVSEEEFCDGLDGEVMEIGREKFWDALLDFFRERRTDLSALRSILRKSLTEASQRAEEAMPLLEAKLVSFLDQQLEKIKLELQREVTP